MSTLRKSHLSRHLARRPSPTAKLRIEIVPLEQAPRANAELLRDHPSADGPSNRNTCISEPQ
jgi:hypothetical protein